MGAWGAGNFDNDTALDWINAFVENPSGKRLHAFLNQPLEADNYGEKILAAAEIVAAWNGHPPSDLPEETLKWLRAQKKAPTPTLKEMAKKAVATILEQSELRELWAESPSFEEWQKIVNDLIKRLKSDYKPPEKTRKKPEKRIWPPRPGLFTTQGIVTATNFCNLRKDGLPPLTGEITGIQIDLGEDYTLPELTTIATWAAAQPRLMIALYDVYRSLGFRLREEWIHCFKNFSRLTLRLETLKTLTVLQPFSNLRKLLISSANKVENWSALGELVAVRYLGLGSLKTLTTIESIAKLVNLRALYLQSLPALQNLDVLSGLDQLECLAIKDLNELLRLPDLSKLSSLAFVEMNLRDSDDIRALAQLPALRELSMSYGANIKPDDFRVLCGHPTLKGVNISGFGWRQRMQEINNILGTTPIDVDTWPDFTE